MAETMLLDAPSLYFRAFFGVPDTFRAPDGSPVNAIRGLLDFIAHLVRLRRPRNLVACLDADWRPAFRVAAIPSYKTHRVAPEGGEEIPDLLSPQVPVMLEVLDAFGIAYLGMPGYEADDVIGTLATRADGPVDIVTGDRDLFQLVDDARAVWVLYIAKGVRNLEIYDEAKVAARYGIPGRAYAAFAALRGDPSDGLPGVPGIGDKSAAALVGTHTDVPGVLAAAADPGSGLAPGVRRKILAAADYLAVAPKVVGVVRDLPVPELDTRLPVEPRDPEALLALADRWGLASPCNRVLAALAEAHGN
ncbi:MAG TPA: 5'-3' exonuclease [Sporichthyaceae bacterium]|nr:5'-3' exonuclease [Sporichthyaceae bacterium]